MSEQRLCFDQLHKLGWHLCQRRFCFPEKRWCGDLLFVKNKHLFVVETRFLEYPEKARIWAEITADLLGPVVHSARFGLFYGHVTPCGRLRGIHQWTVETAVSTICL